MNRQFALEEIAQGGRGKLFGGSLSINELSIDSRSLRQGSLFVALRGKNYDGHDFISDADLKGAKAFVVDRPIDNKKPYILVKDCESFLLNLASFRRKNFTGKVLCVTGSNGKTSTKDLIHSLLSNFGPCHKTLGNKNNKLGLALTLSNLHSTYKYSVIEIATNFPGEIDYLSRLVIPDIALITNVSEGHLDGLGTIEKIAREKGDVLNYLTKEGIAILPKDSKFFQYWQDKFEGKQIISFGEDEGSFLSVKNIEVNIYENNTIFTLSNKNIEIDSKINAIGRHNAINVTGALAACLSVNLKLKYLSEYLEKVSFPERRLSVHKSCSGALLIDDSYNANPKSMMNSLDELSAGKGKRVFIAGEMLELGDEEEFFHLKVCKYAIDKVEEFLCIGDLWNEGLKVLGKKGRKFLSKDELLNYVSSKVVENTVIMVKGSRATGMDYVADELKR